MKTKILLFSTLILACTSLQAQWYSNLNDLYWNDNIGIGPVFNNSDQSPTQTLDVDGTVRIRSLAENDALNSVLVADGTGILHWRNAASLDTNTQLSEADVDGYVSDNGYLTTEVDGSVSNEIQDLSLSGNILSLSSDVTTVDLSSYLDNTDTQLSEAEVDAYVNNNGYLTTEIDGSISNEIQDLNFSAGIITLNGDPTPTQIDLSNYDTDASDDFSGTFGDLTGVPTGLADGDDVNDADADPTNEIQDLSLSGNTLSLSGDGTTVSLAGYAPLNNPNFTGNVGIDMGVDIPGDKLHIKNGGMIIQSSPGPASDSNLTFMDDSGTAQWRIAVDESQSNRLYFHDDISDQARMVLEQNGHVGIGTTNPQSELEVAGTANNAAIILSNENLIGFRRVDNALVYGIGHTNGEFTIGRSDNLGPVAGTPINIATGANEIRFVQGTEERMRIHPGGNVGIGTNAPSVPLEVNGNISNSTGSGGTLTLFESNATRRNRIILGADNNGAYIQSSWNTGGTDAISFRNSAGTQVMTIAANDKVGIGTISPFEALEIVGNIRFSGALMPGNHTGISGQILTSAGAGMPPTWTDLPDNINVNFPSFPQSAGDGGNDSNTYFGDQAGLNSTGNDNTFIGGLSGLNNTTASRNTAIGKSALYTQSYNNEGTPWESHNVAIGYEALYSNQPTSTSSGIKNTAVGVLALRSNTTGNYNTASGHRALYHNTTGSYNTAIGHYAGPDDAGSGFSNTTTLGYFATPTASYQVRLGNSDVTSIGGYEPWTHFSDGRFKKDIEENIPGLEFITRLRPISYDLDREKIRSFFGKEREEEAENATPAVYPREVGFIAQEVEALLNENGYTRIGIETPQNEGDHYSIRYAEFVVPLVKAVQELHSENELLKQRIEALETGDTGKVPPPLQIKEEGNQSALEGFALYQNIPNPFNRTTTIKAVVPENTQRAKIIVYNLQGLELESFPVNQRGNVAVEVSAGRFPSGMYLYTLMADGQLIDTKKMILTK